MKKYYIFEINESHNPNFQIKYAKEIESLEKYISEDLHKNGKREIFFTTGYEDIYIILLYISNLIKNI
jgi:hypothetical protein